MTVTIVCIKYSGKYTLGALGNEALLALLKTPPHLAAEYRRTAERHPCSTPRTCEIRGLIWRWNNWKQVDKFYVVSPQWNACRLKSNDNYSNISDIVLSWFINPLAINLSAINHRIHRYNVHQISTLVFLMRSWASPAWWKCHSPHDPRDQLMRSTKPKISRFCSPFCGFLGSRSPRVHLCLGDA